MDPQPSIGEALRRRREERGLTAEQAAFQSKVPLRLVQVLESDDYHLLPDPLYLIRLLHEYATFLGLDAGALDAEFQRTLHAPPRASLAAVPVARPAPTIPWKQLLWTVAAILVVMPLVFIALSLASKRTADRVVRTEAVKPQVEDTRSASDGVAGATAALPGSSASFVSPAPGVSVEIAATRTARGGEAVSAVAGQTTARHGAAGHVLIARARESTWMSVRGDAAAGREVLLQAGQSARFEAERGFHVMVGNAGGVTLWLDGVELPLLGRSGEVVRDLVLPPVPPDTRAAGASLAAPPQ